MSIQINKNLIFEKIVSILFILLFVYAAVSKVLDYETFELQLAESPILSPFANVIVWMMPLIEILISLLLIFSASRIFGLYASFLLMVMFCAYIIIILKFSDFIPCSCGGVLENLSWGEHIIFNIFFVFLAGTSIVINQENFKKSFRNLSIILLIGIVSVTSLFAMSEDKMHRNNAFQRRFMPHPIERIGEYDLKYNSYYLAGVDSNNVYLANYKVPLEIKLLNIGSGNLSTKKISISDSTLPFRDARVVIKAPNVFVADGTVPIIFRGNISNFNTLFFSDIAYHNQFVALDSLNYAISTVSSKTNKNSLGLVYQNEIKLNETILDTTVKEIFETDGKFLWNEEEQIFLYVYFYKNVFEILGKDLKHKASGNTIDTISKPKINVAAYRAKKQRKLSSKTIVVNRNVATSGEYLFIESERLGKYEDRENSEMTSTIDVYNILDAKYEFSFYIEHDLNKKLDDFIVYNNFLMAIVEQKLILYKLKPKFFKLGFN